MSRIFKLPASSLLETVEWIHNEDSPLLKFDVTLAVSRGTGSERIYIRKKIRN